MTSNINTTTETTTTIEQTNNAPTWVAPATMASRMEQYTVAEIADMFATGELLLPSYQRSELWSSIKGQVARYLDTLLTGKPVPARIWAEIEDANGDTVYLLVDGYQRTSTERNLCDLLTQQADGDPNKAAQLNYIQNRMMDVQIVTCANVRESAELFVRYNEGQKLDGIQRGKAALSDAKLAVLRDYLAQINRLDKGRWGKKTPDAAAMMIAACATDYAHRSGSERPRAYKRQACSNGATAAKVLAGAKIVPAVCDPIRAVFDALAAVSSPTQTYWASPARLVPLCWAAMDTGANAQSIVDLLNNIKTDNADDRRKWAVYTKVGPKATLVTTNKTICEVFADKSNAPGATGARADILSALLSDTPPINANRLNSKSKDTAADIIADSLSEALGMVTGE